MVGDAYGIPTIALRFFNVYGPRQALSNPYTGVLAIFAARILNSNRPLIFEDGVRQFERVPHAIRIDLRAKPLRHDVDVVILEILRDSRNEGCSHRRCQEQTDATKELARGVLRVPRRVIVDDVSKDDRIQK